MCWRARLGLSGEKMKAFFPRQSQSSSSAQFAPSLIFSRLKKCLIFCEWISKILFFFLGILFFCKNFLRGLETLSVEIPPHLLLLLPSVRHKLWKPTFQNFFLFNPKFEVFRRTTGARPFCQPAILSTWRFTNLLVKLQFHQQIICLFYNIFFISSLLADSLNTRCLVTL